jgi:hypothetical protein
MLIAIAAMAVASALVPTGAGAFQKAVWGPVMRDGVDQFPLYHQLGVTLYQSELDWSQIAPTRPGDPTNPADPAYRWPADVQQAIAQAGAFHMHVVLQLINAPAWADGGHAEAGWAPRNVRDFVAFAQAAGREYRSVRLWMVWGEPTKASNFQPLMAPATPGARLNRFQRRAPHLYAQMLDGAYGVLKRIDRRNLVIGGCTYTTGAVDPLQWIKNLRLPDGKPPRMDMYAHNPFSYETPSFHEPPSPFDEVQFSDLHTLAGWVDRYLHKGLPLFLSEWTIPTAPDDTFNFWVDPTVAAHWITDALRLSRRWHRIYALGWINVYDDPPLTAGGLLNADGTPKPGFSAFEHG